MYCKNCGKEIDKDSKFCKYCGDNLEIVSKEITIIDRKTDRFSSIKIKKINIEELFQLLIKEGIIPNNSYSIRTSEIYIEDLVLFKNMKINFKLNNTDDVISILDKYDKDYLFLYYEEYKPNYSNPMDIRCLYGCPGSKKIQEIAKCEVLNLNNKDIEVILDE